MPVPGPRTQFGPLPGYRNPENREPNLFNQWDRPLGAYHEGDGAIAWPGRSAGLSAITLRGCILGAGTVRRLWRQTVNFTGAQNDYSWTENGVDNSVTGGVGITRALRYMTRSLYIGGGIDHTRYDELHTVVRKDNYYKQITVGRGQTRSRPTIRNRLTSFGSRVPTLNHQLPGSE